MRRTGDEKGCATARRFVHVLRALLSACPAKTSNVFAGMLLLQVLCNRGAVHTCTRLSYAVAADAGAHRVTPISLIVCRTASRAARISVSPSRPMQPMRKLSATVSLPG
jgi:hypothetical protein